MDITVNGITNNSTPGGRFVRVNYDNSTTLSSLKVYRTGGGNSVDLRGIRINGKLLVDSGVTVNAPSIAASGCSVGTKQGFSIIKYTGNATQGARVAHGLNSPIDFMIVKRTENTSDWAVGSNALENWEKVMYLNSTASQYTQPNHSMHRHPLILCLSYMIVVQQTHPVDISLTAGTMSLDYRNLENILEIQTQMAPSLS